MRPLYLISALPWPFFTFTYCHFFLLAYDIINDVLNDLVRIKQQNKVDLFNSPNPGHTQTSIRIKHFQEMAIGMWQTISQNVFKINQSTKKAHPSAIVSYYVHVYKWSKCTKQAYYFMTVPRTQCQYCSCDT